MSDYIAVKKNDQWLRLLCVFISLLLFLNIFIYIIIGRSINENRREMIKVVESQDQLLEAVTACSTLQLAISDALGIIIQETPRDDMPTVQKKDPQPNVEKSKPGTK
jgi:hypothetical protein